MYNIKCLRIHHEPLCDTYTVFDRYGKFKKIYKQAIRIDNPPKIVYFGFCPIDTDDVTLEFETPIRPSQIKVNY